MAGADEKLRQYEEALRQARAEIYRQQETARHAALDERSRILHTTREQANQSARQARLDIARDVLYLFGLLPVEHVNLPDLGPNIADIRLRVGHLRHEASESFQDIIEF